MRAVLVRHNREVFFWCSNACCDVVGNRHRHVALFLPSPYVLRDTGIGRHTADGQVEAEGEREGRGDEDGGEEEARKRERERERERETQHKREQRDRERRCCTLTPS